MTATVGIDRPSKAAVSRPRSRKPATVSASALALHLDCSRTYIAKLVDQGVIERRADGAFDQDQCRSKYIAHLRAEHRRSPRAAADAEHAKAKTELLQIRIMEKQRKLVLQEDVDELIDQIAGTVLTHLSGMAARCSRDMQVRRGIDAVVDQIRREIAAACLAKADEWNEPPLDEQ